MKFLIELIKTLVVYVVAFCVSVIIGAAADLLDGYAVIFILLVPLIVTLYVYKRFIEKKPPISSKMQTEEPEASKDESTEIAAESKEESTKQEAPINKESTEVDSSKEEPSPRLEDFDPYVLRKKANKARRPTDIAIAGLSHEGRGEYVANHVDQIKVVYLVKEEDNEYDKNAVACWFLNEKAFFFRRKKLGFIPRDTAKEMGKIMDQLGVDELYCRARVWIPDRIPKKFCRLYVDPIYPDL